MALVGKGVNELTHGVPRIDRRLDCNILSTGVQKVVVLVIGVKSSDKFDRAQKVLNRAQLGVALVLESGVRIMFERDSCGPTPIHCVQVWFLLFVSRLFQCSSKANIHSNTHMLNVL